MPIAADRQTSSPPTKDPPALAGSWQVDPQASHARFLAGTLAGLVRTAGRFRSLSGDLHVDEARALGALVLDSSSIDTGNRMRDRHLRSRDFFHVKRHPQLRYEARSLTRNDDGSARIDGQLTVAGASTPLPLEVTLHAPSDGVLELACQTEVDRIALGVRGARGMVPRSVQLDIALTLRRTPS
ncbi:MAG TPA: YceI family protein [Solirubrobacteraceae bacterium]|jgi:polyisoprenoid-binding protein YceI|nr:YceI family protein [Solirubrobacteraceae bacterium]